MIISRIKNHSNTTLIQTYVTSKSILGSHNSKGIRMIVNTNIKNKVKFHDMNIVSSVCIK